MSYVYRETYQPYFQHAAASYLYRPPALFSVDHTLSMLSMLIGAAPNVGGAGISSALCVLDGSSTDVQHLDSSETVLRFAALYPARDLVSGYRFELALLYPLAAVVAAAACHGLPVLCILSLRVSSEIFLMSSRIHLMTENSIK